MAMGIRNPYFPAIANTWQAGQVFNGAITMTAGLALSNQAVLIRLTAIGNTAYIDSTNSLPISFQYGGTGAQIFNKNGTITNIVGGDVTTGTIPSTLSPTIASGTVYQNTTSSYQTRVSSLFKTSNIPPMMRPRPTNNPQGRTPR